MVSSNKKRVILLLGLTVLLISPSTQAQIWADLVLYNGKILTADSEDPSQFTIAQAVAVYDGKFRAVGQNDAILKLSGPGTQRIDLKGKTVVPGFVHPHNHVSGRNAMAAAGVADPPVQWDNKDDGLAQLRTIALGKKPGEWIAMGTTGGLSAPLLFHRYEVTRWDLDRVTPNNPVYINWEGTNNALLNTLAFNMLLKKYPGGLPGIEKEKDGKGNYNGYLQGIAALTFKHELEPQPPMEIAAPFHKARLEKAAAAGITTVSTWVTPYGITVYNYLDRKGEMPVRVAYGHEGAYGSVDPYLQLRLMGDLTGQGTDHMWMIGVSNQNVDGAIGSGDACIYKEYPRESIEFPAWFQHPAAPYGSCHLTDPRHNDRELILAINRYPGTRISGIHVSGDRALDQYLDLLEEADKESPVFEKHHAMDHCTFVSEEQAQRAKKLGLVVNCKAAPIKEGMRAEEIIYGEDYAADIVSPFRRLIDAGLKPGTEFANGDPFESMQLIITRKGGKDGRVRGPQQRINRREALYSVTRWSAHYAVSEDRVGSIEPGKFADLVVLDKDFLAVPEEEISKVKVLMTMLGGKPTYTEANFAQADGLSLVGYQRP